MEYYDSISSGYDLLHKEEQEAKLRFIKPLLKRCTSLLDIGCGTGISTLKTKHSVGIDPSKEMLRIARKNRPEIRFISGWAENLPFKDNSFDAVISVTGIQNFSDIQKAVLEIERVARKVIIITCLKKSQKLGVIRRILKRYEERDIGMDIMFIKKLGSLGLKN